MGRPGKPRGAERRNATARAQQARQPNDPAEHRSPYVLSAPLAPSAPANLGQAFLKASADTDAFAKIYRHETAIRAGFYRAYEELHRMRAVR